MVKRLFGLCSIALIGATIGIVAGAVPASAATVDFTGIVALSNCSGSVVRPVNAGPNDPAYVLTNGHCVKFFAPGEVIVDQKTNRSFSLLDSTGTRSIGTLRANRLAYATMTDTDIALYRLSLSYAQIQQRYGTPALALSASHPATGTAIKVVSGYWKTIYDCQIEAFVYRLREYQWTWSDSVRYASAASCQTIGGTSGSPVIDAASGAVVGVNNTANENGETCTLDNPCEVDEFGNITVRFGARYGQQTYQINTCIGAGNTINLSLPGCALPKPAAVSVAVPAAA
jgi:V8-like Glu-specific endopeptidase